MILTKFKDYFFPVHITLWSIDSITYFSFMSTKCAQMALCAQFFAFFWLLINSQTFIKQAIYHNIVCIFFPNHMNYIIITIVITLFTRLITVFIYGIIGTISIIFFCDLQTNYKHCLHLLFQPTFIIFYLINFFSKQYGTTLCFKVFDKISSPFFDWYHKNFSISTDVVNSPLRIPLYWKT